MYLRKAFRYGFYGFLLGLLVILVGSVPIWLKLVTIEPTEISAWLKKTPLSLVILVAVFLGPLSEEIAFRGPLLLLIKLWENAPARLVAGALILTSLCFGAVHLNNYVSLSPLPAGALYYALLKAGQGYFYGRALVKSRMFGAALIAHMLTNVLAISLWLL